MPCLAEGGRQHWGTGAFVVVSFVVIGGGDGFFVFVVCLFFPVIRVFGNLLSIITVLPRILC